MNKLIFNFIYLLGLVLFSQTTFSGGDESGYENELEVAATLVYRMQEELEEVTRAEKESFGGILVWWFGDKDALNIEPDVGILVFSETDNHQRLLDDVLTSSISGKLIVYALLKMPDNYDFQNQKSDQNGIANIQVKYTAKRSYSFSVDLSLDTNTQLTSIELNGN